MGLTSRVSAAFTIVELIVTTSILSMFSLLIVIVYQDSLIRSKISLTKTRSHTISKEYILFYSDTGIYPEEIAYNPPPKTLTGSGTIHFCNTKRAYCFFRGSLSKRLEKEVFIDPFSKILYSDAEFIATSKSKLNSLFPFRERQKPGCVLASCGPDTKIEEIDMLSVYEPTVYNPTNGFTSAGDLFFIIPENNTPMFLFK